LPRHSSYEIPFRNIVRNRGIVTMASMWVSRTDDVIVSLSPPYISQSMILANETGITATITNIFFI